MVSSRYKSSVLIAICTICMTTLAYAQELKVVTEDWRPYNYSEGNEVKGVSTDIVKAVLDRSGIKYSISVFPWSRTYMLAQNEPNVLIYTIMRTPQRETLFKWVRPLGKGSETSLYRLKNNTKIAPKTLDEAKHFRIVTNKDSMDELWLTANGFNNLERPSRVEIAIKMFFGKRADLIAFSEVTMKDEFIKLGFKVEDAEMVLPLFKVLPFMALSLSTNDDVVKKIQKAYDDLLKEKKITLVK